MAQLAERISVVQRRLRPEAKRRPAAESHSPVGAQHRTYGAVATQVNSPVSEVIGGLPARLRAGVESLSGIAMDDVRVHRNSSEPAKLGAVAFTRGAEIHLGPGQEEHLPHEAWHVVQQKQGRVQATTQMKGAAINDDAGLEREADRMGKTAVEPRAAPLSSTRASRVEAPVMQRQAAPQERVLSRANVAERNRTIVRIEVIGHASPRWSGAKTPQIADEKNWGLAESRAKEVRVEVEKLLNAMLPGRGLVFQYRFRPSTQKSPDQPVRALDEPADLTLEFQGRGSTKTLAEAGKRGRKANDDPMRRVDVTVTMHSQTETDVEENVEQRQHKSGATRDWSIWVTGQTGVEAFSKAGAILIQLRNEKTGFVGTYAGGTGGGGLSLGINIAKTSPPDYERFKTPMPMTFADFDGASFKITSFGAGIGAFGLEWSKFKFRKFAGGQPTPGGIQVGGLSFGGVEINVFSKEYGSMYLIDNPSETYTEVTRLKRTQTYESLGLESVAHRVFFTTGSSKVRASQSDRLSEYLYSVVVRSGF